MKITVEIWIKVEEVDGDANTFALTRVVSAGDNPVLVRGECETVSNSALREVLGRVGTTYPTLR